MATPSLARGSLAAEQRDADGRLVGLRFESSRVPPASGPGQRWLVAVDGSRHAQHALRIALPLLAEGSRTVDLVHVQPWLSKEAAEAEFAQRAWQAAEAACAQAEAEGFAWRLHACMGDTAEAIVGLARQWPGGGIVVGARGLSPAQALLFGSVAQKVVALAPGCVLVVRAPRTD